ncbi:MAG: hypothetical protein IKH88_10170, partial [Prevotella sp.]|nr:hypothetical protein [Prevotella sp.]
TPKMFCRICNPAEQNIRICNPLKSLFTGFYARFNRIGNPYITFSRIANPAEHPCRCSPAEHPCGTSYAKNVLPDLQSGRTEYQDL